MSSSNSGEHYQEFLHFARIFDSNPLQARSILKRQPQYGGLLLALYEKELKEKDKSVAGIPRMLRHYLNPINPGSNVFCLGAGGGLELVQVRKVVADGRIVAFDNNPRIGTVKASVLNELRADADYYRIDLGQQGPEELVSYFGVMPDIVLCRHPQVYEDPHWIATLAYWGKFVKDNSKQLLITTFQNELERFPLKTGMNILGLSPTEDIWNHGDVFLAEDGRRVVQDKYILGINIKK